MVLTVKQYKRNRHSHTLIRPVRHHSHQDAGGGEEHCQVSEARRPGHVQGLRDVLLGTAQVQAGFEIGSVKFQISNA